MPPSTLGIIININKSYIFGLINSLSVLTFRGSVSFLTGGICTDVVSPINNLVLCSGFIFIHKHVSVLTVHYSGLLVTLYTSHPLQSLVEVNQTIISLVV